MYCPKLLHYISNAFQLIPQPTMTVNMHVLSGGELEVAACN